MALKRTALGRGLDSLISMDDVPARGSSAINDISLDLITPNPEQPRSTFDEEALGELAASIRELGIIQPLSLRKVGNDSYQIIAGERRYRAARMAGLTSVPAYIRTANEAELTEMALIENIQREDLNAIEIALTFKKLIDQYSLTQERLSLLRLPAEVQLGLRDRRIDMGHARALLSITDPTVQIKLYKRIIKEGLSVRKVEELAKQYRDGAAANPAAKTDSRRQESEFDILGSHLSQRFNAPVQFTCNKSGKGKITFSFANESELERLIAIFDEVKPKEN